MRVYVAARFGRKEEVRRIYDLLKEKGHEITADWTVHRPIKPYGENPRMSGAYAEEDVRGVLDADVFLMIGDGGGTGLHVELGAAIASYLLRGRPKIYVAGEGSMFYFHPAVNRVRTVDELLKSI